MADCNCGPDEFDGYATALEKAEAAKLAELQRLYLDSQEAIRAGNTVLSTADARQIVRRERLSRRFFGGSYSDLKAVLKDLLGGNK